MKKFKKPTTLRTRIKKLVSDLNDNFRSIGEEFDGVHQRIDEFNQFKKEFYELRGELDAVIEHLGIDVSVKPRQVIESNIVTKKVKTVKRSKK